MTTTLDLPSDLRELQSTSVLQDWTDEAAKQLFVVNRSTVERVGTFPFPQSQVQEERFPSIDSICQPDDPQPTPSRWKKAKTWLRTVWNKPTKRWVWISTLCVVVAFIVQVGLASAILQRLQTSFFAASLYEAALVDPLCKISVPPPYGTSLTSAALGSFEAFVIEITSVRLYFALLVFSFCFSLLIYLWAVFSAHALELFIFLFLVAMDLISVILIVITANTSIAEFGREFPLCYMHVFENRGITAWFQNVCIALASVLMVVFAGYSFLTWRWLRREVTWGAYEWVGPDPVKQQRVKVHQAFTLLNKLWLFYAIKLSVQVEFFIGEAPAIAQQRDDWSRLGSLLTFIAILVSVIVVSFGYIAARLQNFVMMIIYCVVMLAVLVGIIVLSAHPPEFFVELSQEYGFYVPMLIPDVIVSSIVAFGMLVLSCWEAYYFKNGPHLSWSRMEKQTAEPNAVISMVEVTRNEEANRWAID